MLITDISFGLIENCLQRGVNDFPILQVEVMLQGRVTLQVIIAPDIFRFEHHKALAETIHSSVVLTSLNRMAWVMRAAL